MIVSVIDHHHVRVRSDIGFVQPVHRREALVERGLPGRQVEQRADILAGTLRLQLRVAQLASLEPERDAILPVALGADIPIVRERVELRRMRAANAQNDLRHASSNRLTRDSVALCVTL